MRKNLYTETVNSIKVPDKSVERAIEAVQNEKINQKEKIIYMNSKIKFGGMIAASLAAVIAIGGAVGVFNSNNKNSFVISANAAEITEANSAAIDVSQTNGISYGEGDDDISFNMEIPLSCKGNNIETVTYSVDTGAISVNYYKGTNPIIDGVENHDCDDTPESVAYTKEDQKEIERIQERDNKMSDDELADFYSDPANQSDPSEHYSSTHYSSITLDYNNQLPEGTTICLVGSSKQLSEENQKYIDEHRQDLFHFSQDDSALEAQRVCIEKLINHPVIRCTVKFKDGSEQSQNIEIGTKTASYGELNDSEFTEEMPDEKKGFKSVFVTYSIKK